MANEIAKADAAAVTPFDPNTLSDEDVRRIQIAEIRITSYVEQSARLAVQIGKELFDVKELLGTVEFEKWVKTTFGWQIRNAQNYLSVYREYGQRALPDASPSMLFELSSKTMPNAVREEVEQRLEAGEDISVRWIKRLKAKARAASQDAEAAEEARQKALQEVELVNSHRKRLQIEIADLREENAKLSDPQIVTIRPAEEDHRALLSALINLWNSVPQSVRDQFFELVPYPSIVPKSAKADDDEPQEELPALPKDEPKPEVTLSPEEYDRLDPFAAVVKRTVRPKVPEAWEKSLKATEE